MKKRKINASAVAAVALAVLLVVATTTAATLAWFASQDNALGTFILGEPVVVNVTEADGTDVSALTFTVASEELLPGMLITPDIAVTLDASTTATILRARIDSDVTGISTELAAQLNEDFRDVLDAKISNAWRLNEDDGWYYYLGTGGQNARVMNTVAESSTLTTPEFGSTLADYDDVLLAPRNWETTAGDTVLASLVSGATSQTIGFVTDSFRLPITINNDFAGSEITLTFYVEALQDYLVINDANVLPTLTNATTIFDSISTYA